MRRLLARIAPELLIFTVAAGIFLACWLGDARGRQTTATEDAEAALVIYMLVATSIASQ